MSKNIEPVTGFGGKLTALFVLYVGNNKYPLLLSYIPVENPLFTTLIDPEIFKLPVTVSPFVNLPEPDTSNEALKIACDPVKLRVPIL